MIFDEWRKIHNMRRKENSCSDLSATNADHPMLVNQMDAGVEHGATVNIGPEIMFLGSDQYLMRDTSDEVWVIDHDTLLKIMRKRFGSWRIS